jgi:hypothetical protein
MKSSNQRTMQYSRVQNALTIAPMGRSPAQIRNSEQHIFFVGYLGTFLYGAYTCTAAASVIVGEKRLWCAGIYLEGLRKATSNISLYGWCPGQ